MNVRKIASAAGVFALIFGMLLAGPVGLGVSSLMGGHTAPAADTGDADAGDVIVAVGQVAGVITPAQAATCEGEDAGLFSNPVDATANALDELGCQLGSDSASTDDLENTNATTENEALQEWHTEASALDDAEDNIVNTRANYAYDSRFIAVSEGRIESYVGLNNGLTNNETTADAVARSNDYLAGIEENNLRLQEQHALETYTWLTTIDNSAYADNYTVTARPAGVGASAYEPADDGISRSDADIVVASDGTGDYSSIDTAVSNAAGGDVIYVDGGEYDLADAQSSYISASNLTIIGANEPRIIDSTDSNSGFIRPNDANNPVVVRGFVVDGEFLVYDGTDGAGVVEHNTVLNNPAIAKYPDATYDSPGNDEYRDNYLGNNDGVLAEGETAGSQQSVGTRSGNIITYGPFAVDPAATQQPTETVTLVNGTQVDVTALTVDDGTGNKTVQVTKYFSGGQAWKLVAQPPESSNEPHVVFDGSNWERLSEDTQQTQDYVDNNVRALVDTVYTNYNAGDVNATDVLSATDLERQFATDYESTGALAAVQAQAAIRGYSTDLNASVNVDTYQSDNDLDGNVDLSGALWTRASAPSDVDNDSVNEWEVGTTYDTANFNEPIYVGVQTQDGVEIRELSGQFQLVSAQNPSTGQSVSTVENEQYSYADADNGDLQQQQDKYTIVVETEENRTSSSGGGGGGGSGIGGATPILFVGATVAGVYIIVRMLRDDD